MLQLLMLPSLSLWVRHTTKVRARSFQDAQIRPPPEAPFRASALSDTDEEQVDAKIREIDQSIADLQERRRVLVQSKQKRNAQPVHQHGQQTSTAAQAPQIDARTAGARPDSRSIEKAMSMLEWRNFKKKDGEWTFLRDMKGNLAPDLVGVSDFVDELRKGRQVVVGKYRYSVSEDKFLNRFIA